MTMRNIIAATADAVPDARLLGRFGVGRRRRDRDTNRQRLTETNEIMPGLTMKTINNGYGRAAVAGDLASVHYTGWLYDETAPDNRGEKFDSSVDRGQVFQFPLGAGRVIQAGTRVSPEC